MDAAEALAFARKNPHAVLATMKRDGTPQLSPVLVGVDSQDRLVVSTRETAMKTLNVRRDPRAWLCVLNDRFFGDWAQLSGDVEVVSLPEAMEPLVEYYRSISGEHPDWDDYRDRHDQTAPLLDPDHADESRSERHRLIALSTVRVKNRVSNVKTAAPSPGGSLSGSTSSPSCCGRGEMPVAGSACGTCTTSVEVKQLN